MTFCDFFWLFLVPKKTKKSLTFDKALKVAWHPSRNYWFAVCGSPLIFRRRNHEGAAGRPSVHIRFVPSQFPSIKPRSKFTKVHRIRTPPVEQCRPSRSSTGVQEDLCWAAPGSEPARHWFFFILLSRNRQIPGTRGVFPGQPPHARDKPARSRPMNARLFDLG